MNPLASLRPELAAGLAALGLPESPLADRLLDYLALLDPADLSTPAADYTGEAILAVAAKVGTTRLIDNVRIKIGPRR